MSKSLFKPEEKIRFVNASHGFDDESSIDSMHNLGGYVNFEFFNKTAKELIESYFEDRWIDTTTDKKRESAISELMKRSSVQVDSERMKELSTMGGYKNIDPINWQFPSGSNVIHAFNVEGKMQVFWSMCPVGSTTSDYYTTLSWFYVQEKKPSDAEQLVSAITYLRRIDRLTKITTGDDDDDDDDDDIRYVNTENLDNKMAKVLLLYGLCGNVQEYYGMLKPVMMAAEGYAEEVGANDIMLEAEVSRPYNVEKYLRHGFWILGFVYHAVPVNHTEKVGEDSSNVEYEVKTDENTYLFKVSKGDKYTFEAGGEYEDDFFKNLRVVMLKNLE